MPSLTLSEIAELCGARVDGDGSVVVRGPAGLAEAGPDEVSFLAHRRYRAELGQTRAAGVLVEEDVEGAPEGVVLLRCANPGRAFSNVIQAFAGERPAARPGVHPTAVVEEGAELGDQVSVGPLCFVGADAELGPGVVLHSHVSVGPGARVGAASELHPGVVLYPGVSLGARCILHAGAVIGSDGFGFEPTAKGWDKTPQAGTVEIGDDVEIGANSTIDCARFGATRIGDGSKIDNLVHIAHNVQAGEACLIIAQSGVAGSSTLGRRVVLAGQSGVSGHLTLGDGARLGGGCQAHRDVPAGQDMWGAPALPKDEAVRMYMAMPKLRGELKALAKRLAALEDQSS